VSNFATFSVFLISLVGYIIVGIRLMRLCDNSGVSLGWFAFIPFLNYTRWARLAGSNPWLVLIWIIPIIGWIIGIIMSLVWLFRIAGHTLTKQWFWIYLITIIAAGFVGGVTGSVTLALIIGVALTIVQIAAMWMIFDPTKPIRRGESAEVTTA